VEAFRDFKAPIPLEVQFFDKTITENEPFLEVVEKTSS
jgi:hypothetical protein